MYEINKLVRTIALVILLAGFMEMLLPNNSMRRFVQLIMGLFVLMAVLSPLSTFLGQQQLFEITFLAPENNQSKQALAHVIEQGTMLREQGELNARTEAQKMLERQAKALVLTIPGVDEANIEVVCNEQGVVERLDVNIGAGKSIPPVMPVGDQAGVNLIRGELSEEQTRAVEKIKARLGDFLLLTEEKITVQFQSKP